jgi:hypothetical protein
LATYLAETAAILDPTPMGERRFGTFERGPLELDNQPSIACQLWEVTA